MKAELDLSKYATKDDLKGAIGVVGSSLAAKSDFASLKAQLDKINADKIKTVPPDLSKQISIVDNDVKKTAYDN